MNAKIKYTFDNLPQWGLKEITIDDFDGIGDFLHLPKSGFFICRQGTLTIGDRKGFYTMKPNDMIIYPLEAMVFIKSYSRDIKGTIGITDMEEVMRIASKTVDAPHGISILSQPCISLTAEEMEKIDEIGNIIQKRLLDGDTDSLPLVTLWNALCYEIAGIYKGKYNATKAVSDKKDDVLLTFLFSLKEHIFENRQVQFYAKEQCLSTRYFSTLIKERTGMGALEIITKATMNVAKSLLADPSLTIKEVSYKLNFPNPSFFVRWFKQHEGVTPSAFRK